MGPAPVMMGAVDLGAVAVVAAMLLGIPVLLMSGALVSAVLGWALQHEAEATHPGSELIDLNR